ncbi:MAG TPA: L-seryl-tRNA(Sec) selenium transferase [Thermoanaerobaculia bacterium]|nr:L-seryl-tRNA(Sec) selenium transferase [Thermoanaerobaculia bacterium]
MRKAAVPAADSAAAALRSIPSVERVLSTPPFVSLASEFGRDAVKVALTRHLASLRERREPWEEARAAASVRSRLEVSTSSALRRVINGTGVIIHTNLGRSPVDPALWSGAADVVAAYSNLEFDLATGARGKRDELLGSLCRSLFGCEAAILTNNNAAAVLLLLSAVAAKREVIVSRGELVEIGGGFRVPEVIQQGGAKLREVGTTNRTRSADYAGAVSRKTAAILRVHRSNFDIVGFTETPSIDELVAVAKSKRVPLLYDEGSGRVVDLAPYGFSSAPTIRELIESGADAVTCSTDKLIGATQGGLIIGREEIVERCRRHPLLRAVRAGKESYAIVGAALRAFATGKHEESIPIYRMLATPVDELRRRAEALTAGTPARVIESRAVLGGGTTPNESIPSIAVAIDGDAAMHDRRFLESTTPIAGRVADEVFTIDLRTVLPEELPLIRAVLSDWR